ncbi:MAG: hypothetical protein K9J37_03395 [Saprospiraceae bacterium]|nr:hypothetical protein [Saprospiraceae bacterium]MCF8248927.1 hypothetical protein [Saprospiraceae bacterium]MCF8279138.1 hypothetical protein [Bacteroidales bacterium]MCF8310821.1 hypothetical protein [Saprospiraceae bacterium]MCF8439591.1 hypothetical protein [Saprospiraceae bacterium]
MKKTICILGFAVFSFSCTQETVKSAYHGETDTATMSEFNQHVGQSPKGFSESYRASYTSFKQTDPLFYDGQKLFKEFDQKSWIDLSSSLRDKLSLMSSANLSMEIQLLSLMMIDRRLLRVNNFSTQNQEKLFYDELRFYLQLLVENEANDLDVLTKSLVRLNGHTDSNFFALARTYILQVAEKDKTEATGKLKNLEDSIDPMNFDLVSKRHYEQVLWEAEYAISNLAGSH